MNIKKEFSSLKGKGLEVQLNFRDIRFISNSAVKHPNCKFLIFGMGYDSLIWHKFNREGRTVFIEDDREWWDKINGFIPDIEAYLIKYHTKLCQWKELLDSPLKLKLDLPDTIINVKWDVIFVDGPKANSPESPGRMSSIYMASRLIKDRGDIFVHDCNREVEITYADKYLGEFRNQIRVRKLLRHYTHYDNQS